MDVDDCFLAKRDPRTHALKADEARFPGGIAALAEYVHKRGLHLGIYNDIGPGTCAGDPGLNVSAVPDARADAQVLSQFSFYHHFVYFLNCLFYHHFNTIFFHHLLLPGDFPLTFKPSNFPLIFCFLGFVHLCLKRTSAQDGR